MKKFQTKYGFTIIELLVYIGLFTILLTILANIFSATLNTKLASEENSAIQQDGKFILARLTYDINRVDTETQVGDSIVTPTSINTPSSILQLKIAGVTYTYKTDANNNLTLNDVPLNGVNTTISQLQFLRLGGVGTGTIRDSIQLSFILTSKVSQSNQIHETKSFTTTATPR